MAHSGIDDDQVVETFLTASRALVGIAVASIEQAPAELTMTQHRVLVLLAGHGALSVGDLAQLLGVPASSATRHIDRLERGGLVERERSTEDARVVRVSLRPAGGTLVKAVTAFRRDRLREVLDTMTARDRADAARALAAFNRAAREREDLTWAT